MDSAGGRLYVDGVQKASQAWTGTAGAPTTTQEIRIGQYSSYLPGTVDEYPNWRIPLPVPVGELFADPRLLRAVAALRAARP